KIKTQFIIGVRWLRLVSNDWHYYGLLKNILLFFPFMRKHFNLFLLLLILLFAYGAYSQVPDTVFIPEDTITLPEFSPAPPQKTYEIAGVVKDKNTDEGIPFAVIFFPNSDLGTMADLNGNFSFKTFELPTDTLRIEAIGYTTLDRMLDTRTTEFALCTELIRSEPVLEEFILRPGEEPEVTLLKNIIKNKPHNNPDNFLQYQYEVYNKIEIDLERLSKAQFEKLPIPYMKKFSFIYDNLDTTETGTPYLPFYLTETLSDYYYRNEPKKQREFIKARQTRGIDNESVTKFLGSMYQNINVYDNFIPVFDKKFVSPISNQGLFYYKYKIKDTQTVYGRQVFLVQF